MMLRGPNGGSPDQAADDVGLAVLAAITNSNSGQIIDILETLAEALDTIDQDTAEVLAELTMSGLHGTDGQQIWRMLMATTTATTIDDIFG